MLYSAAMRWPPPSPKMCSAWPHWLHTCTAMFSTMPRIGTPTFSNILMPFLASRNALRQGQLDVAGAGRQVDDQVIQVFPVGLAQELLQRLRRHRAAPDHGLV